MKTDIDKNYERISILQDIFGFIASIYLHIYPAKIHVHEIFKTKYEFVLFAFSKCVIFNNKTDSGRASI